MTEKYTERKRDRENLLSSFTISHLYMCLGMTVWDWDLSLEKLALPLLVVIYMLVALHLGMESYKIFSINIHQSTNAIVQV